MKASETEKTLFPQSAENTSLVSDATVLEIYKLAVEMADRVSERRQSANSFYLSINTAFLSMFYIFKPDELDTLSALVVAVCGVSLCVLWLRNISSYKDLNSGKFAIICLLEERLGCAPYTAEWSHLKRGLVNSKYRPFTQTERAVPVVFLLVFVFIFLRALPWDVVSSAS